MNRKRFRISWITNDPNIPPEIVCFLALGKFQSLGDQVWKQIWFFDSNQCFIIKFVFFVLNKSFILNKIFIFHNEIVGLKLLLFISDLNKTERRFLIMKTVLLCWIIWNVGIRIRSKQNWTSMLNFKNSSFSNNFKCCYSFPKKSKSRSLNYETRSSLLNHLRSETNGSSTPPLSCFIHYLNCYLTIY